MNSWFRTILCITCLLLAGPAFAQEELTPEQQAAMEQAIEKSFEEEITVTGSLIPRADLTALSGETLTMIEAAGFPRSTTI